MIQKLTNDEMAFLSNYEGHFNTAIKSQWSRYPGIDALTKMHRILERVTGVTRTLRVSCGACTLRLVQDIGRIYFSQKEADEVVRVVIKEKKPRKPRAKKTENAV